MGLKNDTKAHIEWLFVFVLFVCCLFVRFIIADYKRVIYIYGDEQLYYQVAKNILNSRGLTDWHHYVMRQKLLYSFCIAPIFRLENEELVMRLVAFLNSAIVSAGVFPVYRLAKKILKSTWLRMIVCLLWLINPDLTFSMTYMSEVLFLVLGLFILIEYFDLLTRDESCRNLKLVWVGVLTYIVYLCKEVTIFLPITYVLFILIRDIKDIKQKWNEDLREIVILAVSFVVPMIIANHTIFRNVKNVYTSQIVLKYLTDSDRLKYLFYSAGYYWISIMVALGLLFIIPIFYRSTMNSNVKAIYYYILLLIGVTTCIVAFTISIREDFGSAIPRNHLRYLSHIWFPMIIVFSSIFESGLKPRVDWISTIFSAVNVVLLVVLFKGATWGSGSDHTMLAFINDVSEGDVQKIKLIIIALLIIVIDMLFIPYTRKLAWFLSLFVFSAVCINNNIIMINRHYMERKIDQEFFDEFQYVSDMVKKYGQANFLIIDGAYKDNISRGIDTFLSGSNTFSLSVNTISDNVCNGSVNVSDMVSDFEGTMINYVLARKDLDIDFDETTCEKIEGFDNNFLTLYYLSEPSVIKLKSINKPFESSCYSLPINSKNCLSGQLLGNPDVFISGPGNGLLACTRSFSVNAGKYKIVLNYECLNDKAKDTKLGTLCLSSNTKDISNYAVDFYDDNNKVILDNIDFEEAVNDVVINVFTEQNAVKVSSIEIYNEGIN